MTDETRDPKETDEADRKGGPRSVLTVLQQRTGEAPRITLRDEDSVQGGSPLIDPTSDEKATPPGGRGNYQLMGEIARGGMGVVLKGHDSDLGRDVALKVLSRELAGRPEVVRRFVEEAQIGGQLQHPGIVPVYELGLMADERPYFTMKLVKGRTLASILAEGGKRTDRRRLLEIFGSVCQTMAYAHSRGVLHRDLKPANVMVGAFGEVQVVDWGLAKVVARGGKADERRARDAREIRTVLETVRSAEGSGSGSDSMVGSVLGTPEYMSPEQAQGQVDRLDERSDVFGLGAMLCEILTGFPPYYREGGEGNTLTDAARGRTDAGLERLDACEADPELVELTKECLLAAPAARPGHAGVVAERFQEYLRSVEERARAAQIEAAVQRRGRKLTVALAATILVATLGAGGVWTWGQQKEIAREREVAQREREVQSAVTVALNEASVAQGEKRWDDAFAAAGRARAVAETGGAGDALLERVEAVRTEVERAGAAERSRIEREQANARFLASLGEALMGDPAVTEDPTSRESLLAIDALCTQVFRDEGIEIDATEPAAVAAALKERGIGAEIAPILHRWLIFRRLHSKREGDRLREPEDKTAVLQLVEIAHAMDDDPLHADLREAMLNDELEILRELAASDLSKLRPSTINLLGVALSFAGEDEEAMRVLAAGTARHPDDVALRMSMAELLPTPWDLAELRAAQALRPDYLGVRRRLFSSLRRAAATEYDKGSFARARELNRQAILEERQRIEALDDVPSWEMGWLGAALADDGDIDGAIECFRRGMELRPVRDNPYIHVGLASGLFVRGDLEEAAQVREQLVARRPGNFAYECDLAATRVLLALRDRGAEAAIAVLRDAAEKIDEDPATVRDVLAQRLTDFRPDATLEILGARPGRDRESLGAALEALWVEALRLVEEVPGDLPHQVRRRGLYHYRVGDLEGARPYLEESFATLETPHGAYYLALLEGLTGDLAEARRWYDRATRMRAAASHDPAYSYTYGYLNRMREEVEDVLGFGPGR